MSAADAGGTPARSGDDAARGDTGAGKRPGDVAFKPSGFRDERTPTLRHRAEYALFGAVRGAIELLPRGAAEAAGGAVGRLGHPLGVRREVTEANLRQAFPEADEAWIRATARAAYAHLGREMMAMLRLAALSPEALRARSSFPDVERFRTEWSKGRGVVLVAGHLGNWEVGAATLAAHGFPVDLIARRQSNPLFNRMVLETRARLGLGVIDIARAQREALKALRAGHVVAFGADQNAGRNGVFVPFFGRPASTHRGAAVMALRTGAPMILGAPVRAENGGYLMRIRVIDVDREGEQEAVVARLTAAFTRALEEEVRMRPGQYLWQHRRWRSRPPEEPRGTSAV